MGQTSRVSGRATSVFEDGGYTCVRYHQTVVIKWNEKEIVLDSGGWRTVTTKTRINQASNQYSLGVGVYQRDGEWRVTFKGDNLAFSDGMVLTR